MRTQRGTFISILVLLVTLPLCGDEWEELRARPGNDDVFVMIDTSSSMAPSLGGSLSTVKAFLQDLFARYLKDGDRIILMTFDADARVHSVVPIVERRRDTELLRDVIDGLDARRVIHYRGTYPDLNETNDGPWVGGGAWTDYCEMWRLSARMIEKYSDPAHRQLFLLFTDGMPEAPSYRQCEDPGAPGAFAKGLRQNRLRMGVVALPAGSRSADGLSAGLTELLRRMPGYDEIRRGSLKVIDFKENGRRIGGLRREVFGLINSRLDLVQPRELSLGPDYVVSMNAPLTIVNRSRIRRTVSILDATLFLTGAAAPMSISVRPSSITLRPGESGVVRLVRADLLQVPGQHRGRVVINFDTASHFDPSVLAFSATKQTWLEAYGRYATCAAIASVVVLSAIVLRMAAPDARRT